MYYYFYNYYFGHRIRRPVRRNQFNYASGGIPNLLGSTNFMPFMPLFFLFLFLGCCVERVNLISAPRPGKLGENFTSSAPGLFTLPWKPQTLLSASRNSSQGWTPFSGTLDFCSLPENLCHSGICEVQPDGSTRCICPAGRTGRLCEADLTLGSLPTTRRPCTFNSCLSGGQCFLLSDGSVSCECPPGFEGRLCETKLNCAPPCNDVEVCVDAVNNICLSLSSTNQLQPGTAVPKIQLQTVEQVSLKLSASVCQTVKCPSGTTCVSIGTIFTCKPNNSSSHYSTAASNVSFSPTSATLSADVRPTHLNAGSKQSEISDQHSICSTYRCENGGTCIEDPSTAVGYYCLCIDGFSGHRCEVGSGPVCDPPCQNNGSCQELSGSTYCKCRPEFSGYHCERKTNFCARKHCLNGGTCVNQFNNYSCICTDQWMGRHCEYPFHACANVSFCHGHGVCASVPFSKNFTCRCFAGFTGSECEVDIDECANVSCPIGRRCVDLVNAFRCVCPLGFTGEDCSVRTSSCDNGGPSQFSDNSCLNGGVCVPSAFATKQFRCRCPSPFTGPFCEYGPGGLCQQLSPCKFGQCVDVDRYNYKCVCQQGYAGQNCTDQLEWSIQSGVSVNSKTLQEANEPCFSNPCLEGQRCVNADEGRYECVLERSGPCEEDACTHGGTCVNDGSESLGYFCLCPSNFSGVNCEIVSNNASGFATAEQLASSIRQQILDFNRADQQHSNSASSLYLKTGTCSSGSNCSEQLLQQQSESEQTKQCVMMKNGTELCSDCGDGFSGDRCEVDVDECLELAQQPCYENHTCINTLGGFLCQCPPGFWGDDCGSPLLGCQDNPCPINSTCRPFIDSRTGLHTFQCFCASGFFGQNCEKPTTAAFSGESLLAVIAPGTLETYQVAFRFRTTLPDVYLVTGENILGASVYGLELTDGRLELTWINGQPPSASLQTKLHTKMNTGNWFGVQLVQEGREIRISLLNAQLVIIESKTTFLERPHLYPPFNTKFGGPNWKASSLPASALQVAAATKSNFVGCMQDMEVNERTIIPADEVASSANVALVCERKPQCDSVTCSSRGVCTDLWLGHRCECDRPYIEPNCAYSMPEATFGHEQTQSYATVTMNVSEKSKVEVLLDVSMMLKTRASFGQLVYIGSSTNTARPELDTFLVFEIFEAQLQVNVKLGHQVKSFRQKQQLPELLRLTDGQMHLVHVVRQENNITAFVDKQLVLSETLDHPFPHPLLAEYFFVAGTPSNKKEVDNTVSQKRQQPVKRSISLNPDAFHTKIGFKGVIQDLRVNDRLVPFFALDDLPTEIVDSLPLFGHTELSNVLPGTISDDVCVAASPCENNGVCQNTFNDYVCECDEAWRGRNCSEQNFCSVFRCPGEMQCKNLDGNFACLSPVTFGRNSSARFHLQASLLTTESPSLLPVQLSFIIRTRDRNGVVFYVGDDSQYLALELYENALILRHTIGTPDPVIVNLTEAVNISDGSWHNVSLTFAGLKSSVAVDNGNDVIVPFHGPEPLMLNQLFVQNHSLVIGSLPHETAARFADRVHATHSFKGCLNLVAFGSQGSLPVQFLEPVLIREHPEYGGPEKFVATKLKNVELGCHGDNVCGLSSINHADNSAADPPAEVVEGRSSGPCANNGSCLDLWNSYECVCIEGFTGKDCSLNIDDCDSNSCANGSSCVDGVNSYSCACAAGYTGRLCDVDIDDCASTPCQNGATCFDRVNGFECQCTANYSGTECIEPIGLDCNSSPCLNNGRCKDALKPHGRSFDCECTEGYFGRFCEKEKDFCLSNPCSASATCSNWPQLHTYICNCPAGYTGKNCESNVNECLENPCIHGRCQDYVGNFSCFCELGWEGQLCDLDTNECVSQPCQNSGSCVNVPGRYLCQCPQYYLGVNCELRGSCVDGPCVRGDCNQTTAAEHHCVCPQGYTGTSCEKEIDHCSPNPCFNNATCNSNKFQFQCICPVGFQGERCELDFDDCQSQPCRNNGSCIDSFNSYKCDCTTTGFQGNDCEIDVDECLEQRIQVCVHGSCLNTVGSYQCQCSAGWIGPHCDYSNPCSGNETNQCSNGARCVNAHISDNTGRVDYDCVCPMNFEGKFCETQRELRSSAVLLELIVGPIVGTVFLLLLIGLIVFIMLARSKRATRGTYSPSRQEMNGTRLPPPILKPPLQERLI